MAKRQFERCCSNRLNAFRLCKSALVKPASSERERKEAQGRPQQTDKGIKAKIKGVLSRLMIKYKEHIGADRHAALQI